jgi:hypothetical protein
MLKQQLDEFRRHRFGDPVADPFQDDESETSGATARYPA